MSISRAQSRSEPTSEIQRQTVAGESEAQVHSTLFTCYSSQITFFCLGERVGVRIRILGSEAHLDIKRDTLEDEFQPGTISHLNALECDGTRLRPILNFYLFIFPTPKIFLHANRAHPERGPKDCNPRGRSDNNGCGNQVNITVGVVFFRCKENNETKKRRIDVSQSELETRHKATRKEHV